MVQHDTVCMVSYAQCCVHGLYTGGTCGDHCAPGATLHVLRYHSSTLSL